MRLVLGLLLCSVLSGACLDGQSASIGRVRSLAGNFETNLYGQPDTRPSTWGVADSAIHVLMFKPPVGCRVEILRLTGDFVAWPMGVVPAGTQAGTLISISRTGATGSVWADYAADGYMLYHQVGTSGNAARLEFDEAVVDGLLGADNQLDFKMADWLNNTGLPIHMEVTFLVRFRFIEVKDDGSEYSDHGRGR